MNFIFGFGHYLVKNLLMDPDRPEGFMNTNLAGGKDLFFWCLVRIKKNIDLSISSLFIKVCL